MLTIIRLLGKALAPRRGQVAPIIFMDTARCHGHARVLRACRDTGIVPIFIPAKATWLLQPLDTHAFALYKAAMRRAYNDAHIDCGNNVLYTVSWIWILVTFTQRVLQGRTWKRSFAGNGFPPGQPGVRHRLFVDTGLQQPLQIGCDEPSAEDIKVVLPKRQRLSPAQLLAVPRAKGAAEPCAAEPSTEEHVAAEARPWCGRTRSTMSLPAPYKKQEHDKRGG